MIITNYQNLFTHIIDKRDIEICTSFIANNIVEELPCGIYELDGMRVYANVMSYQTKDAYNCMWEAHRRYIDIHYIISGEELIKVSDLDDMTIKDYIESSDYLKICGSEKYSILMEKGSFLFLMTNEAHKTGCNNEKSVTVKKIVFKISV